MARLSRAGLLMRGEKSLRADLIIICQRELLNRSLGEWIREIELP